MIVNCPSSFVTHINIINYLSVRLLSWTVFNNLLPNKRELDKTVDVLMGLMTVYRFSSEIAFSSGHL